MFAEICAVPGVCPEAGVTDSQVPPDCVAAEAVQLIAPEPVAAIVRDCGDTVPPVVPEKASEVGLTVIPGLPTVMVTKTTTVLVADDDTNTIAPV